MPALTTAERARAYRSRQRAVRPSESLARETEPIPVPIARRERSTGARTKPQTWQATYAAQRGMTVDQVAQMLASETPRETIARHIAEALAEPSPHSNYYVTATDRGHRWTYGRS